jgi:hypothetical protein
MIKKLNKLLTCLTVVNEAKRSTGQSIEGMMSVISGKRLRRKILCLALLVAFATCAFCQDASTLRPPKTFYVSKSGSDSNTGTTPDNAFLKIQTGIDHLEVPGDSLRILPGTYTEFVTVQGKVGSPDMPIVIEGLPGISRESVVIIQGCITNLSRTKKNFNFHQAPNQEWELPGDQEAHAQEYVSIDSLPEPSGTSQWHVSRGAFINPVNGRYTRLITYSRLEDLRAENETYDPILHPPVYMGPGVWFDSTTKKVHIRLSPTHNGVMGLADYSGSANPNMIPLSITEEYMQTLNVHGSRHILFKNISVRFGGETIRVEGSTNIAFDNVIIWAGQYGMRTGKLKRFRMPNCVLDGGLPTWMFRSDLKEDKLGKNTMETLFLGNTNNDSTEMDHCEFINAHDLYLGGKNFNFHHNWVSNLNDEGLVLDATDTSNGSIHHNVLVQILSVFSFAGTHIAGPWHIYRNLVDLRTPTAGYRPRDQDSDRTQVWRVGYSFKMEGVEGPFDLFQNTFIVPVEDRIPYNHLRSGTSTGYQRRSLNNIFVVLNREVNSNYSITYLPPVGFPAEIKNNLYWRKGNGNNLFYIPGFHQFSCNLEEDETCSEKWSRELFFQKTGYEANSILLRDPEFISWVGEPDAADDFRLKLTSPARNSGVQLPPDLQLLDNITTGSNPDIGCYQSSSVTGKAPN